MNKKDLIKLASANANQLTNNSEKSEWEIRENITGTVLGTLPSRLNEDEVFNILAIARKYELEAFNSGIVFGKRKQSEISNPRIKELERKLQVASNENERLANALEAITTQNNSNGTN